MLVTVCTAVLLAGMAFGNDEGYLVLSHTGAPVPNEAPEQTCFSVGFCHDSGGDIGDDDEMLQFSTSDYSPGDTVNLTVTVTTGGSEDRFGFQVTALNSDEQSVGTFDGPGSVSIESVASGREYTSAASFVDDSWEFNWTADDYYGDMTFWITAAAFEIGDDDSHVTWARSFQLSQHNRAPSLSSPQVTPDPASESDTLEYSVTYTDPDGDEPEDGAPRVYVDGSQRTDVNCDNGDGDIETGRLYTCSLAASAVGVGNHDFYFGANDDEGAAANDTELQTGPFINDDPALSLFGIAPNETMYPDDLVNVTVVYTDANDQAPSVWICVNNCASDNRTLDPADWDAGTLSDGDYANGELFFLVDTFPVGTHTLTAGAHDTLNMSNSLSGGLTVRDDIPRLSNAQVSPAGGGAATIFNLTVVFTDFANRNGSVFVNVGDESHAMSAIGDGNTSDGEEFYWTGTVAWGTHDIHFSADNGLNDAVNLSGGSVAINDAPDISDGSVVRVGDDFTFSVNASDINTGAGDIISVLTDIADHGPVTLSDNNDGTFSVTVPQSALISIGGDRTATFTVEDLLGGTNQTVEVTFVVDIVAGFSLAADSDAKSGPPGEVDYTFTITNTGNHEDTFSLSHTSAQGWIFTYSGTATVPRGDISQVTVTVTVPFLAPDVVDAESVTATSGNNGSLAITLSQTTTVAQAYGVAVTAVSGTLEGARGATVSHTFLVQNTGNGADTFDLGADGAGWSAAVSGGSSVPLNAGGAALVTVTHTVGAAAAYMDSEQVTLSATSQGDGSSGSDSSATSAGLVRSAMITLEGPAGAVNPGASFLIRGNLTNTGNGASSYGFGIAGDSVANGWAELNATSSGTLAADTSSSFNLWISVPEDTPAAGSYDVTVQAHGFGSDTATFTITVNARGASVSAAETSFRLNPGSSATTEVTVTNTGSVATDYTLVVDDGHDYVRFSTTSFNVAKGGFQVVLMTVIVPSDASGALSAGFTVSPLIDGSGDSLSISINPNLPQDTSSWAMDTAGVDSNTQFTFTLTGLAGDFTIDWDFGDGSAVSSDGGLSQTHSYSTSGAATVSLIVTDDLGQVTSFSTSFVVANAPPDVSKPSVSAEGDTTVDGDAVTTVEGTEVEFVLMVPTDSDGSLTLLRVDWGDGTHRAYSGSDLSGPTLNLGHTYWEPGTYQVSVTAVDNSADETIVQAQEVTVREGRTVLEEGTNQLGLLLLLAVFGLALSATAYHIRKQGFSGDEAMNEQERARLSTLEQRMDTVREREELLEVAAYDAARVTTKLEDHIGAFNEILVKAQEIAAQEKLAQLEAEEADATAAETQRELDLVEPDLELLAERFHGTLGRLVETRTELGHIEEQLAYVLKMERDEQFEKLTELTESYESTRRKIEALENIRTAREQAREESNLMDLLSSKEPVAAEDDFAFADDDHEDDDTEEYEVEIYEDEDGSFYYIDPDSGEEVPSDEDGNPL